VLLPALIACGDGNEDEPPVPVGTPTPVAPADLVPELDDLGYEAIPSTEGLIEGPGALQIRRDFQDPADGSKATIHLYTHSELAMAEETYTKVREAWKNPPPGSLGSRSATNVDTDGPELGDESHSFRTEQSDSSGRRIWTDIYRFGRTVAVVQVLDVATADAQMELRTELASRVEGLVTG